MTPKREESDGRETAFVFRLSTETFESDFSFKISTVKSDWDTLAKPVFNRLFFSPNVIILFEKGMLPLRSEIQKTK